MDELDNFQSFLKYLGIFSVICSKMDGPRDYRTIVFLFVGFKKS